MASVDWEQAARAAIHPLRLRIMERAAADTEARFSASELADQWGEKLGNVSYHVRELYGQGLLIRVGHRTVRGAIQRYYAASSNLVVH